MKKNNNYNSLTYLWIGLSFAFAFCFMIVPVSPELKWLRPDLVTLVLIYWVANMPATVGILCAFIVGLLFDLLSGLLFGSTAFTLSIVAFLTMSLRLRLRIYRYWQKFTVIMLLIAVSQLIKLWIQIMIGHPPATFMYWLSSITSTLTWPLVYTVLHSYQRSLRLAS